MLGHLLQEDAEAGCEVDWSSGSRSGADCEKLESFEGFIREIGGSSPMSSFAHMLFTLRRRDMKVPTEGGKPFLVEAHQNKACTQRSHLQGQSQIVSLAAMSKVRSYVSTFEQ